MKLTDFDAAVEVLVEAIRTDYRDFTDRGAIAKMYRENGNGEFSNANREMTKDFDNSLSVKRGSKYTKIIQENRVWGFIVNEDGSKFKRGDILKAASWAAPALNKARGNIFSGYRVQWTGPYYL